MHSRRTFRTAFPSITSSDLPLEITPLGEPVNLDDLGPRFDIIVAYGAYPDALPSPTLIHYALLINTALAPLDDPAVAQIIRQAADPAAFVVNLDIPQIQITPTETVSTAALQTALANAGWPDGFDLSFAHQGDLLAIETIRAHFQALNISLTSVPLDREFINYQLALVTWTSQTERDVWAGLLTSQADMIELFALPISYWTVPDLQVGFTSQGWPVPLLN